MIRGRRWIRGRRSAEGPSQGYTIVETLIFLAISAAMFVSVMILLGGRQHKTEFEQSVRDFESQMTDIANDVSTGSASVDTGSNICKYDPSNNPPFVITAGEPSDSNDRCIFVGRAIVFSPTSSDYTVYSMVQRKSATGFTTGSGAITTPKALDAFASPKTIDYGVVPKDIWYESAGFTHIKAFGLFTTYGPSDFGAPNGASGSLHVATVEYKNGAISTSNDLNGVRYDSSITGDVQVNASDGITICLRSAGSDQHANVTIGGDGGQSTVASVISDGDCVAP